LGAVVPFRSRPELCSNAFVHHRRQSVLSWIHESTIAAVQHWKQRKQVARATYHNCQVRRRPLATLEHPYYCTVVSHSAAARTARSSSYMARVGCKQQRRSRMYREDVALSRRCWAVLASVIMWSEWSYFLEHSSHIQPDLRARCCNVATIIIRYIPRKRLQGRETE
jgi:hypothetical protein